MGARATVGAFLHRHPILLLLALTPGIPEYLSGSTRTATLAVAPPLFLLGLALNLGLYGPGVLLAREAFVRWRPGWAGMLLLGSAYGLLEEGTALSTLFDPHASVVQSLGSYGHFGGVNAVWLVGVLGVHTVYSVGLPIVLLGLALPETRGRPLLGNRGLITAAGIYAADIILSMLAIGYYRTAPGLVAGAAFVAVLLYLLAWKLPRGVIDPPTGAPRRSALGFFLIGCASLPLELVLEGLAQSANVPAVATIGLVLVVEGALFWAVRSSIGTVANERSLVCLALGAILPLIAMGIISQFALPLVLGLDAVAFLFFAALLGRYPAPAAAPPVPAGSAPL
jgi:hypothetical protein